MDWKIKGRAIVMGSILIVLGLVLYFVKGVDVRTLVLPVVGIVMLIIGSYL